MNKIRAVAPYVEVIDAPFVSGERISLSGNASGHNIGTARDPRIGRIRVIGKAGRGIVDDEEWHRRHWRGSLDWHIRRACVPNRRHRHCCSEYYRLGAGRNASTIKHTTLHKPLPYATSR